MTGMTLKDLKYVEARAKGLNKTDSARVAGFSESMANAPQNIENKPQVQDAIQAFQAKLREKISDERIANKLNSLMDAERLSKFGSYEADNQAQLKATELAMRAQNYLTSDKGDTNVQVNIQAVLD